VTPQLFDLTPCIPLSFEGEGGGIKKRGLGPLLKLLPPSPLGEGGQRGMGSMLQRNETR